METEAQAPGPLSVVQVLFSPAEVFRRVAAVPRVLVPLLLLLGITLVFQAVVVSRIPWEEVTRKQMEENPQIQQMPEDKREEAIQQAVTVGAKFAPVAAIGGVIVIAPLVYVAMSALFWILLKLAGGSDWGFKAAMSATLHACAPALVGGLVGAAMFLAADPSTMDIEDPIKSHVGALVSKDAVGPFVHAILRSLDVFSFWVMAMMVIGYGIVARVSRGAAAGVVVGVWGVYVLAKGLFAIAIAGITGAA
jgi:hypothetical protein